MIEAYQSMHWAPSVALMLVSVVFVGLAFESVKRWKRTDEKRARRRERHRVFISNMQIRKHKSDMERASRALTRANFEKQLRDYKRGITQ